MSLPLLTEIQNSCRMSLPLLEALCGNNRTIPYHYYQVCVFFIFGHASVSSTYPRLYLFLVLSLSGLALDSKRCNQTYYCPPNDKKVFKIQPYGVMRNEDIQCSVMFPFLLITITSPFFIQFKLVFIQLCFFYVHWSGMISFALCVMHCHRVTWSNSFYFLLRFLCFVFACVLFLYFCIFCSGWCEHCSSCKQCRLPRPHPLPVRLPRHHLVPGALWAQVFSQDVFGIWWLVFVILSLCVFLVIIWFQELYEPKYFPGMYLVFGIWWLQGDQKRL